MIRSPEKAHTTAGACREQLRAKPKRFPADVIVYIAYVQRNQYQQGSRAEKFTS